FPCFQPHPLQSSNRKRDSPPVKEAPGKSSEPLFSAHYRLVTLHDRSVFYGCGRSISGLAENDAALPAGTSTTLTSSTKYLPFVPLKRTISLSLVGTSLRTTTSPYLP